MSSGQPGFENHQLAANLSCAPFLQQVRQTQNAATVFGRRAFQAATVHWPAVRDGDSEAMRLFADWIRNGVGQNGCNLHDSVALYRAASELGNEGASIYLDLLTQNGPQGISADMEMAYLIFTHFPGRGQEVALFKLGCIFHTRWERATEQLSQTPANAAAAKVCRTNIKQNIQSAMMYYRRAIERGHTFAMVRVGILLQDGGEELQRDIAESIALYEKAADLGCIFAMAKLTHIYKYGCKGIEIDKTKGFLFQLRAADLDDAGALCVLALSLMYEDAYPLELTDACKSASGNGNSVAKNIFEDIKRSKDIGPRNPTATAVELFQRAADLGDDEALLKLGVIFLAGLNGIEKDCIKAYQLLLQAAENGKTRALYWLAFILEDEDSSEFEDICRSAGKDDSSISKQISDDMTRNDEIGKRPASVAAVRLLRRAASSGHAAAMGRLGTSLAYGYGVQRDIITGIAWMEKAVKTDPSDIDLKATLAKALTSEEVGEYVNINRAIELLEEATQQYPSFCYGLHHLAVLYCLRGDNAKRDNFRAAALFSRASVLSSSLEDPRLPMTERIIRAGEHYPAEIDAFLRTSHAKPRTSLVLVLGGGARGKTSTANSLRGLPFIPTHITTEMAALNKFLVEPGASWLDDSVTSEYEYNETSLRANSSRPQASFRQSSDNGTDGKEAEGIETAAKESIRERDLSNHSIFKMRHSKHADIIERVRGSMTMPEFPKGFRKSVAQVWDMAGQSKYEMTHALVIVRASVLVFVTDLSKVCDARMRKHEVEILCYWMQLAHFIVPDASKVRVIIVGTRKDACDHRAALQALKAGLVKQLLPKVYDAWIRNSGREDMPKFFAIENSASLQNPKESGLEELQGALKTTMDDIVSARGSVPLRWLALVDKLERESQRTGCSLFRRGDVLHEFVDFPGFSKDELERERDIVEGLRCLASMGRLVILELEEKEWCVFMDVGKVAGLLGSLTASVERLRDRLCHKDAEGLGEGQISQTGLFCLWDEHSEAEKRLMLKILCRFDLLLLLKGTEESIWDGNTTVGIPGMMRGGWEDFEWGIGSSEKHLEVETIFDDIIPNGLIGYLIAHVHRTQVTESYRYGHHGGLALKVRADAILIRMGDGSRVFLCFKAAERKLVWKFRGTDPPFLVADFIGNLEADAKRSSVFMNVKHRHVIIVECKSLPGGCMIGDVELRLSRNWLLGNRQRAIWLLPEALKRLPVFSWFLASSDLRGHRETRLPTNNMCCQSCLRGPWSATDVENALWQKRGNETTKPGAFHRVMPPTRYDVFISHAGTDKLTIAKPLMQSLSRHNVNAFLDFEGLPGVGRTAPEEMNRAMGEAHVGVFILSPEFAMREWPMRELRCFLDRDASCAQIGTARPILLPVFYRLNVMQCATCEETVYGESSEFKRLRQTERFLEPYRQRICSTEQAIKALKTLRSYMGIESRRMGGGEELSSAEIVEATVEIILRGRSPEKCEEAEMTRRR